MRKVVQSSKQSKEIKNKSSRAKSSTFERILTLVFKQLEFTGLQRALASFFTNIKNGSMSVMKQINTYKIVIICLTSSVLTSIGIVYYSAEYGKEVFPSYWIGVLFLIIIENGLITLFYISNTVLSSTQSYNFDFTDFKTFMRSIAINIINTISVDKILILFLLIMSAIPSTLGAGKKNTESHAMQKPVLPIRSPLIDLNEKTNLRNQALYDANQKKIDTTQNTAVYNRLSYLNSKLQKSIEDNTREIKAKELEYEKAMVVYNDLDEKYKSLHSDEFAIFLGDFYFKVLIILAQILSLRFTVLSNKYLGIIRKNKKNNVVSTTSDYPVISPLQKIDTEMKEYIKSSSDLSEVKNALDYFLLWLEKTKKYTDSIEEQMIELNGVLGEEDRKSVKEEVNKYLEDEQRMKYEKYISPSPLIKER